MAKVEAGSLKNQFRVKVEAGGLLIRPNCIYAEDSTAA